MIPDTKLFQLPALFPLGVFTEVVETQVKIQQSFAQYCPLLWRKHTIQIQKLVSAFKLHTNPVPTTFVETSYSSHKASQHHKHKLTFCQRDSREARLEHAATNQQFPSCPWCRSCALIPSTNKWGSSHNSWWRGTETNRRETVRKQDTRFIISSCWGGIKWGGNSLLPGEG